MEPSEEKIYDKLDKINDHLGKIDVTLSAQHISLDNHIKRTSQLEQRMIPLEKHVVLFSTLGKLGIAFGSIIGVIAGVLEIIHYFK